MPDALTPRPKWLVLFALAVCVVGNPGHAEGPCALVALGGDDSGIGGTGFGGDDSGIGGTGFGGDDSGVGGTGFGDAQIGVLGTITGFASVCVNGLEIHYEPDVPVTRNGEPAIASDLAVGRVAWIVAEERGNRLIARSISLLSLVTGPVESVDLARRQIRVSGDTVLVPDGIPILGSRSASLPLEVGARVEVSGLRFADGRVVATRIDPAAPGPLGSTRLRLDALLAADPNLERVSIEGYPVRIEAGQFRVSGVEVDARASEDVEDLASGARVVIEGTLREGALRAERIVVPGRDTSRGAAETRPDAAPSRPRADEPAEPPERLEPVPAPPSVDRPVDLFERPERPDRPVVPERPVIQDRPQQQEVFDRLN